MGLETYTGNIADMVATNPQPTDPKSQGDDHLRGIKFTLQQSFPNFTGPLDASKVPFTPSGNIGATNVQAAIQELDTETQAGLATKLSLSGGTISGNLRVNSGGVPFGIQAGPTDNFCIMYTHTPNNSAAFGIGVMPDAKLHFGTTNGEGLSFATKATLDNAGNFAPVSSVYLAAQAVEQNASGGVRFNTNYGATGVVRGFNNQGQYTCVQFIVEQQTRVFELRNDGVGYAPAGWQTGSDERVKSNITLIPEALAKIQQMRGCTFHRDDLGRDMAGVIAQDLQAVLPVGVNTVNPEMLTVDPMAPIALLIEAVKELKAEVDDLRAQLAFRP